MNFKPLNAGLGFHPFENGLPYAPTATPPSPPKRDLSRGTGAVAAGKPSFVIPKVLPVEQELGWDYLAKRALAYLTDTTIHMGLGTAALIVSFWGEGSAPGSLFGASTFPILICFLLFFNWALITAQEIAFGTSLGKKFFGLSLEAGPIRLLARSLFFVPSFLFLGAGLLWALFDSDRRCFHDLMSGAQPEES